MKKPNILLGLLTALLFTAVATADNGDGLTCCDWDNVLGCTGPCLNTSEYCVQVGFDHTLGTPICDCRPEGACRWIGDDTTCSGTCEDPEYICNLTYVAQQNSDYCECLPTTTTTTTTSSTTTSSTTTTLPETCNDCCKQYGYPSGGYCASLCPEGTTEEVPECGTFCIPVGSLPTEGHCCCIKEPPPVPEFVTPAIALAILLTSPAFAYLLLRRRH